MYRYTFKTVVMPGYQLNKFEFIKRYYIDNKMSDIEIVEMIQRDTGYKFSRMSPAKWRHSVLIKARNPHQRFQLAVDKKRFDHTKVAQKIDYKRRKINYGLRRIDYNRVKQTNTKKFGYKWAINLDRLLKEYKITDRALAQYLKVSHIAVWEWKRLINRVKKNYQNKICKYPGVDNTQIFVDSKPTNNERNFKNFSK